MKSVLITCLKDEVSLIQSSHLINSLRKDDPHTEVSVLTYKDFQATAKTLEGIKEAHFIDRHKIEHLKSGALYSDAFAINTLVENLLAVFHTSWDKVINFSNDETSAYLIPMLQTEAVAGSTVSVHGATKTSDKWSAYRNFYASANRAAPIDPLSCSHHYSGIPYVKEGKKIALNQEFTMVANQNFARIRADKGPGTILVGLNLSPSLEGSRFQKDFLFELMETFEASSEYKAVLLLGGGAQEREISNELNKRFDNALISINMDVTAAPSVIANLDFLITRGNAVCALADAMETRIIQVADAEESSMVFNDGNFLIRELSLDQSADDVLLLLNQENDTVLPMALKESSNKVYARVLDDMGAFNTLIRGKLEIDSELDYHVTRCFHHALLGYPIDENLLKNLKALSKKEDLKTFSQKAKEELTSVVKILLAALRSLQSIQQSEKNASKFVQYLDQLMLFGKEKNIAQAPICLFEASVENISFQDPKKNLESMESCLFELKSDLQILTKIFEHLLSEKSQEAQKEL